MRWTALALALMLSLPAVPAAAEAQESAIARVIGQQIAAFRAGDMVRAFTFAAPGIRARFRTAESFGEMVATGYPMIRDARRIEMLGLVDSPHGPVQRVLIEDPAGRLYEADYLMTEVEGQWRIAGVSLRRLPGVTS